MKTVSLITASYNRGHTIGDTIQTINRQTYQAIEHIVIDGQSTDNSMELVRSQAKRLGYCVSEPDKGFYDAYNKGLARATGDIVGFLNTDDFYCSDSVIETVVRAFDDPSVEGVHADLVYVDAVNTKKILRHWKARNFGSLDYVRGFIPAHPTVFVRRDVYERLGGYDTRFKLAADYDFLLRAFHVAAIKAVHIPQVWVRMRVGGATGGALADIKRQNDEIFASRAAHGVHYPKSLFYARKFVDRTVQRLRAPYVVMPD